MDRKIYAVCGPTAVGKTKFAIEIARFLGGEIVSCDSMQLYKYMDIGSAKPTADERAMVRHYLVDEIDPREPFSAAKYQKLARAAIDEIFNKEKVPVITGGTGLYLNAILYDMDFSAPPKNPDYRSRLYDEAEKQGPQAVYERLQKADPQAAERIHPNNVKKVVRALEAAESGTKVGDFSHDLKPVKDYEAVLIGLTRERSLLYQRINERVDQLIEAGLLSEVKHLLEMGLTESDISMKGIGYKEIIGYYHGEYSLDEAVRLVKKNTRRYAKRQLTWFRRYETMKWFCISDYDSDEQCLEDIFLWLKKR
ncbi:MAG: tRNA (adenosine(37)-N6)-dimethylallyltransferase MiaA [Anaerovoracaceae bacterium]